jgi:anti-anti-sigma regulatory factor
MPLFDQTSPPSVHQRSAPMLKISIASQSREKTVLKIEGWVSDSGVAVLERELVNHLQQAKQLLLDFTGVMAVDADGIDLLRRNRKQLQLRAGSAFIRALLSMNGLQPEN